ncbi:MAG: helix-turn-helix domain-containing protein [Aequoribacter sp.]|jgi:putative transcriptional regulator|uniref:helix-turn-helix domain-containing protein n=1 Tax=Aequoribacter sp. TaxID=2847771 RepID=UPI003C53BE03
MKSITLDLNHVGGRIDEKRVENTSEADISRHMAEDEHELLMDAAKFAKRVRNKLGFSQPDFAKRIHVPLETVRKWEQGTRRPTGAAQTLLVILDKVPEAALSALER